MNGPDGAGRDNARTTDETRIARELEHGRRIAAHAERTWGWSGRIGGLRRDRRVEMLIKGARIGPNVRVLELGCGTGTFTSAFIRAGAELVAIDLSLELLGQAGAGSPGAHLAIADATRLPVASGSFDAVVGSSVLHHLPIDVAIREIRRVLRVGGLACFTEPNMLNPQIALQKNIPPLKRWLGDTSDETAFFAWDLAARLRAAGFRAHIEPFDFLHPIVPAALGDAVDRVGRALERVPLLREIAGSLYIRAVREDGA